MYIIFICCPIGFELPHSLEQECWDFDEIEGGVCSFSPALQAPSHFQTFLGSCLVAWLTWKKQTVFFLLRERDMNPRRAGRKIENHGGSLVSSLGVLGITP